jgi:hypothetical protein
MSLETLANLGEFLAAIGMLISLVYLALQLRQNTEAVRGTAQQTWSQTSGDLLRDLYSDPVLAELFQRVAKQEAPASDVDRFRFHVLMTRLVRNAEALAYLEERNLVDHDIWEAYLESTRRYMALPGFRGWIEANDGIATPRMRSVLRRVAAEAMAQAAAAERAASRPAHDSATGADDSAGHGTNGGTGSGRHGGTRTAGGLLEPA